MADLSPAAQKALDAAYIDDSQVHHERISHWIAVEVIRAVADHAHPKNHIKDISYTHQNYVDGWKDALDVILAIADELDGHSQ
jgi:hypothetical protein